MPSGGAGRAERDRLSALRLVLGIHAGAFDLGAARALPFSIVRRTPLCGVRRPRIFAHLGQQVQSIPPAKETRLCQKVITAPLNGVV